MTRLLGAIGLIVLSAMPAGAAELTLSQAVAEALERNPRTRMVAAEQREALAARAEARSAWLPRVDVSEAVTTSNNPVFVFGSLLEQGRFGAANFDPQFLNSPPALRNYRLGLNVRYTLFDQLGRLESGRQSTNAVARSNAAADETIQAVRVDAIAKFYGLLVAEARREVAREAVRTSEADAAAIREKFRQGLLVESDALAAEVQLASFRQQEIEAEGGAAIARAALNATIGRSALANTTASGVLPRVSHAAIDLAPLLERGLARRGELTEAQLGNTNARLQMQIARGSLLPRIDTFASWGASGNSFGSRNGDRTIGAVVSLDLFDGAKFARVAQAAANADRARAAEDAARSKVELEIVAAYEHVRSAEQRVNVASTAVDQALAAARIVRDRYEQGLTTITEHLRAQTALLDARQNLLSARYDHVVGAAELARATGEMQDVASF